MTRYLDLAEYLWLAEQVTGVSAETLSGSSRIELADSALHAPAARFGDTEFYPDVMRLARNHPLPDGNKRAAWAALLMFIDLNGGRWDPDPPDIDDAEATMLAVRAAGPPVDAAVVGPRHDNRCRDQACDRSALRHPAREARGIGHGLRVTMSPS